MIYADVIVNITAHALDRPFQYRIPEALRDKLEVGSVVTVPFGNGNRPVTGYVIGLSDQPALEPERIKELSEAVLEKLELPWKSKPSFPAAGAAAGAVAASFWPKKAGIS